MDSTCNDGDSQRDRLTSHTDPPDTDTASDTTSLYSWPPTKAEEDDAFKSIHTYLVKHTYPNDATRDEKRRLRERSSSFVVQDGVLMHLSKKGKVFARVIRTQAERDVIVADMHAGVVGGNHFGQTATIKTVTERFWWGTVVKDIVTYIRSCDACQRTNPSNRPPPATLHPLPIVDLFHRWGIDLIGPLQESESGMKYIAVGTEYLTRWAEAQPIPDKSADSVHRFMMSIVCRFGCANMILHDQGKEFNNKLINELCDRATMGVAMTSAYHPQTNGLVPTTDIYYIDR
jgi:hypothetical protein